MRLRIDLDDTTVDLATEWIRTYNLYYNDDLRIDSVQSWGWHTHVKPECGWKIYDILAEPNFFLHLKPVPGAIESLVRLHEAGHEIVFVSAIPERAPDSYGQKIKWLQAHVPFFERKNFIAADRKELVGGDLLFDDGAHNLGPYPGIAVGMNRPWNSAYEYERSADIWIESWEGFERIVGEIAGSFVLQVELTKFAQKRVERHRR